MKYLCILALTVNNSTNKEREKLMITNEFTVMPHQAGSVEDPLRCNAKNNE